MEEVKKYFNALKKKATLSELPYGTKRCDYTITFVQPILGTMEGFYKMVVPGMAFNRMHPKIRCIFPTMQMFDDSLCHNDYHTMLKRGLLKITDHLVFPFVSYSLADTLIQAREVNPNIKFSYHIDFNYYDMPDSYAFTNQYKSAEAFGIIERNIAMVDRVYCSNKNLSIFLNEHLKEKLKGSGTQITWCPIMFDKHYIYSMKASPKYVKRDKFCIGIIAGRDHFSDINFIRGSLKEFMAQHGDQAEIVMLGYNGIHKTRNYMKGIKFNHIPYVNFFDYYQTIIDQAFNVVLIPSRSNQFTTTSKNYTKWLEFTGINVPVLMPNTEPYNQVVKHNVTGILCATKESWIDELTALLNNQGRADEIMDSAYSEAMNHNIDLSQNMKILERLYII